MSMITVSLSDPNVVKNVQNLLYAKRELGFDEESLQIMYDKQVEKDERKKC